MEERAIAEMGDDDEEEEEFNFETFDAFAGGGAPEEETDEERDARRQRWLSQEAPPTTPTAARLSAPASPNAGSRPSPGAGASSGRSASCREARRSFRDAVTPVAPRASRLSSFRPPSLRRLASRERAAPPAPAAVRSTRLSD